MNIQSIPLRVVAFVALLAIMALGCMDNLATNLSEPALNPAITNIEGPASTGYSTTRTFVNFTVGPLALSAIDQSFPGHNWHLRDVQLSGPVTGDLTGNASVTLNANLDAILGSGPAWGTMTIVTNAGDTWEGTITGNFESGAPNGIRLFSYVVLQGPNSSTLRAECNETSVTSETLACIGDILNPHP